MPHRFKPRDQLRNSCHLFRSKRTRLPSKRDRAEQEQHDSESDGHQSLGLAQSRLRHDARCLLHRNAGPEPSAAAEHNPVPVGANFNPANADPTNPKVPLSSAFLRPTPGYENIGILEAASSSNYHSLQVSANRRFAHGVQFGANWTWSKAMDFNDNDIDNIGVLAPRRSWNCGLASFDRTHDLKITSFTNCLVPASDGPLPGSPLMVGRLPELQASSAARQPQLLSPPPTALILRGWLARVRVSI